MFLIPILFLLLLIPETPRWLAAHERSDEALEVLRRLYRRRLGDVEIERLHSEIVKTAEYEKALNAGGWREILKSDGVIRLV